MAKIAYELAFLWLGEAYLDDPVADELRTAICKEDVTSMDQGFGWFGCECAVFNNCWTPHEAHHLAFANILADTNSILIAVRIFDILAAVVTVSKEVGRYFQKPADNAKLRFLALDSVSGKQISTTFAEEIHRVVMMARGAGKLPPAPDPL